MLDSIKKISLNYPGNHPIILYLENSQHQYNKVKLSDCRITTDHDCLSALRKELIGTTVRIGI